MPRAPQSRSGRYADFLVRIDPLQLTAVAHTQNRYEVTDSREVTEIAESYAASRLPILMDWLDDAVQMSILCVMKNISRLLSQKAE